MSENNKIEKPNEIKSFLSEIQELTTRNNKDNLMTSDYQLERLFSQKFQNPYDVLLLRPEAPDEEIRKQFRSVKKIKIILLKINI